jgi:undecaprenyl-diphosphatase
MPDLLKAAILGIVQGLTEFLPVSSTGHLVLLEKGLDVSQERLGLAFDAAIHLGTLLAILVYFWETVVRLVVAGFASISRRRWDFSADSRLAWLIVIGTVPAALIGFFFENTVEEKLRDPAWVATMLILFSAVLVLAELSGTRRLRVSQLGPLTALFVGLAQAAALMPGVSRSGITISAGLFAKLERQQAAVFAFLLSGPIVAGAGFKKVYDVLKKAHEGLLGRDDLMFFVVGFILAAITGYFTIRFFLAYLQRHTLYPFVVYRLALGVIVLVTVLAH